MFRVKICGITNQQDGLNAAAVGADALGFNFYQRSRRYVLPADAEHIVGALPPDIVKVGVFVNSTTDRMLTIAERVGLDAIQLHGDEPVDRILGLHPYPVIRAFRCGPNAKQWVRDYIEECRQLDALPAAVLIDAYQPNEYGGTGTAADWKAVRNIAASLPDMHVVLAGGLHADNVRQAIATAKPSAVDVAGGVERVPGHKDKDQMRRFVNAARIGLERLGT